MPSASELLEACNSAILELLQDPAQEKVIDMGNGKQVKYSAQDLDKLRRFRDALKSEVQADTNGSPFIKAAFI